MARVIEIGDIPVKKKKKIPEDKPKKKKKVKPLDTEKPKKKKKVKSLDVDKPKKKKKVSEDKPKKKKKSTTLVTRSRESITGQPSKIRKKEPKKASAEEVVVDDLGNTDSAKIQEEFDRIYGERAGVLSVEDRDQMQEYYTCSISYNLSLVDSKSKLRMVHRKMFTL